MTDEPPDGHFRIWLLPTIMQKTEANMGPEIVLWCRPIIVQNASKIQADIPVQQFGGI
jgi:hypothetical protein